MDLHQLIERVRESDLVPLFRQIVEQELRLPLDLLLMQQLDAVLLVRTGWHQSSAPLLLRFASAISFELLGGEVTRGAGQRRHLLRVLEDDVLEVLRHAAGHRDSVILVGAKHLGHLSDALNGGGAYSAFPVSTSDK